MKLRWATALALVLATLAPLSVARAGLFNASLTLSTIRENAPANHTIVFTHPGSSGVQELWINYNFGSFSLGGLSAPRDFDILINGTNLDINNVTGVPVSVGVIDWDIVFAFSPALAVTLNSVFEIRIGNHASHQLQGSGQIINPTAAQNDINPRVGFHTFGVDHHAGERNGSVAVEIVADDRVQVSATIASSITCSFSGSLLSLGTLTTGAVAGTSNFITISTNAGSGFNLTVRGAGNGTNPGLFKATPATYLIGSANSVFADNVVLAAGTDGYGLQAAVSGGSGASTTVDPRFNRTGNDVGGLELTPTTVAAATGPVANRAIVLTYRAAVSGLAFAGSYTDTLTYVCTGNF